MSGDDATLLPIIDQVRIGWLGPPECDVPLRSFHRFLPHVRVGLFCSCTHNSRHLHNYDRFLFPFQFFFSLKKKNRSNCCCGGCVSYKKSPLCITYFTQVITMSSDWSPWLSQYHKNCQVDCPVLMSSVPYICNIFKFIERLVPLKDVWMRQFN